MYKQIITILLIFLTLISTCSAEEILKLSFENDTICIDDSINENHGTYANVDFINGFKDQSIISTHPNSIIELPHIDDYSFTDGITDTPFSMGLWLKTYTEPTVSGIIYKGVSTSTYEYFMNFQSSGILRFGLTSSTPFTYLYVDTALPYTEYYKQGSNGWNYIVITYDGSHNIDNLNMYINGIAINTDKTETISGYLGTINRGQPLRFLCKDSSTSLDHLYGEIDEIIFYNNCLTYQEISEKYNTYIETNFTITLINNELLSSQQNISIYKNSMYIETVEYGESIQVTNLADYSFILHEDNLDRFSDISNVAKTTSSGVSYIVYAFMLIAVIALLVYMYRRF